MEFQKDKETNANSTNQGTCERTTNCNVNCEVPVPCRAEIDQTIQTPETSESRLDAVGIEMTSPADVKNETVAVKNDIDQERDQKDKKSDKPRKEKPKEEVTFRTHLTSLAHVSVLFFVYTVIKLAFNGDFDFFTWHPILMSLGWMLLMTQGFFAINKYNTYWRFKTKGGFRVKIHVTLLAIGYTLSIIGFAIVYINKNLKNKNHFVSWHAIFGLIGLIATFPPVLNGFVLWYKKELAQWVTQPRLVKFVHVLSGSLAFTFGALSLILSVYTKWYARRSNNSDYIFYIGLLTVTYPLIWAVYGPTVKLVRVVKEYCSEEKED